MCDLLSEQPDTSFILYFGLVILIRVEQDMISNFSVKNYI